MRLPEARQEILVSEGIILKKIRLESASEIFEAIDRNRHSLRTWLPFVDNTWKAEDTEMFLKAVLQGHGPKHDILYEIRRSDEFIGLLAIKDVDPWNKKAELGYWLVPEFENKGIMTNACKALIDSAFRDMGMNRIQIKVGVGNSRSSRIAEKIGFRFEGIERAGEKFPDHYIDLEVYSLLRQDWKKSNRIKKNGRKEFLFMVILMVFMIPDVYPQSYNIHDDYLVINAAGRAPLFTTYTAAPERSKLYGDKGYKMIYDDNSGPLRYGSENGGSIFGVWEIEGVVVASIGEFHQKPLVVSSFPDMVVLEYQPWPRLQVTETFFVYSSGIALVDIQVINNSEQTLAINYYPIFQGADSLSVKRIETMGNYFLLQHNETRKRLISNLPDKYPYPTRLTDIFTATFPYYSHGAYTGNMRDFYNHIKTDFYSDNRSDSLNMASTGMVDFVALHGKFTILPGDRLDFRYFRGICPNDEPPDALVHEMESLEKSSLQPFVDQNVSLFGRIPRIAFSDPDDKIVYLSAFNLVRGCMLPPYGETSYNYYVFSREPLWGWGHGHQVLHESLSMLAYCFLDPVSAQNSQRVYMEQQADDGLIAYRHGPRGPQTYPHKGQPTTSAPFYSWINLEVFRVSRDTLFLAESYESGVRYVNWLIQNRDTDQDGTFEWGPYGIIENVRDWYNAVFQVSAERYLDVDKEDISDELECLDLSLMMVKEMRSLSEMAHVLGKEPEALLWEEKALNLGRLINERMWDPVSGFFYSVNKADHGFFFMTRDLRRQEIIGFLALWAGVASKERADTLAGHLSNPDKFWRQYGVPTLSADDPWYSPYVDYCCKWNGPVWLLWDYMVFDGLVRYGYHDLARELAQKMLNAVKLQLRKNHNFWESYSPDNEVLNCPSNYIWDSIVARLLIDLSVLEGQSSY